MPSQAPINKRLWSVSARELRGQLLVLVIVMWTLAALNVLTEGARYRTGEIKGADFVHFYVLGRLAADGQGGGLYDLERLRAEQERLVPDSKDVWFVPIYGPQTALLFAGLAALPYFWAAFTWALLTATVYGMCVWIIWRWCPALGAQRRTVALGALGFLPFFSLVLHGQTSVLPLACVTAAFVALARGHPWWAGLALGSLIIKPQFGIAVAVVMIARREWKIVGGAVLGVLAQWGLSVAVFGPGPMGSYLAMLGKGATLAALLEPKPFQLHSLRAFWSMLIPDSAAAVLLYGLSSAAVLALATRMWSTSVPLATRYSAFILATVLVSPHVGVYDLVVLAPAFLLTADAAEQHTAPERRRYRAVLYSAYLVPLVGPLASITHIQLSIPVFSWWLAALYRSATQRPSASPTEARPSRGPATPSDVSGAPSPLSAEGDTGPSLRRSDHLLSTAVSSCTPFMWRRA